MAKKKISPYVCDRLIEMLELGNYFETAAAAAGVTAETARVWIRRGTTEGVHRAGGGEPDNKLDLYVDFSERAVGALAEGESALVQIIHQVARTGKWRAAMTLLERRWAARWGERTKLSEEEAIEGLLERLAQGLSESEYRHALESLAKY